MFCKDVRCEVWADNHPPIEIGGFKMLDVICALKIIGNKSELHPFTRIKIQAIKQ